MQVINIPEVGSWEEFVALGGIYCGRSRVLGCKFVIGEDGTVERVLHLHKQWLWHQLTGGMNRRVQVALGKLQRNAILGCYWRRAACPCHNIAKAWWWWTQEGGHRKYASLETPGNDTAPE